MISSERPAQVASSEGGLSETAFSASAPWDGAGLRMRWHLLALAAAMLLPVLAFALIGVYDSAQARRAETQAEMQVLAVSNAEGVERGLAAILATAQVLATSPDLQARDIAAFRHAADDVAHVQGVSVVLRNSAGDQLVATRVAPGAPLPTLPPEDFTGRRAIDAGQPYVSSIFTSGMTEPFLTRVVVPAVFGSGPAAAKGYAVEIEIPPELTRRWLEAGATPAGWVVEVIGQNGTVIARNIENAAYVGRGTVEDSFAEIHGLAGRWRGVALDGSFVTGAYTRLHLADWIVAVGAPDSLLAGPLRRSLLLLLSGAVLVSVLGLLLSIQMARGIERGAAMLAVAAKAIGGDMVMSHGPLPVREFTSVAYALAAAGQEIAARTAIEQKLLADVRRSRDLLQAVVDGTSDPIFARDLLGRFVLVNQAGAAALGLPHPVDAEGCRVEDLSPPQAALAMLGREGPASTNSEWVSVDMWLPDGTPSPRSFHVSKSLWRDRRGEVAGVVCVAHDMTERAHAEARLMALQANLARAGRLSAVAAMAAGLAHELNQPLSAAMNFLAVADVVTEDRSRPSGDVLPVAREAMQEAADQVARAGDIVRRLRTFLDDGETVMSEEVLAPLVQQAAQAAWRHAADPAATLQLYLDPALRALVEPIQLQQVVSNLVRNAAEALREAPDPAYRIVQVGLAQMADGGCVVSVVDTGPGIDPALGDRLFDVFEGSHKEGGMGVGLAICRTIVAAHGGQLWAENVVDGGAAFHFTLPRLPILLNEAPVHEQQPV
jgi:PAS domain S-box-containing protein